MPGCFKRWVFARHLGQKLPLVAWHLEFRFLSLGSLVVVGFLGWQDLRTARWILAMAKGLVTLIVVRFMALKPLLVITGLDI